MLVDGLSEAAAATSENSASARIVLPERPLITIQGNSGWAGFELKELWAYRELLYFLAWRDVKVRYKQSALGAAWAILQPATTMIIFTVLFGGLAHVPSDGAPYAIFSYAGLLPWNFFSTAVGNSGNSLVGNANLITKVYFPRLVIPGAAVGAALVDFAIASALLFAMMPWYGTPFTANLLMFPALTAMTTLAAAAVGMWTSALNVKYRDVRHALPFLIQIWMYLTPIIYPISFIPARWRWALRLNPLSAIIEGYRDAIFGRPFDWAQLALSAAIILAMLAYAAYAFRRMEREFADII
ncbi:MAG TPA: ABC transporter permease [Candidatus Binataceae bacterium]|nr:ABC transporter permease [Candidatus Binataceae bacterium]